MSDTAQFFALTFDSVHDETLSLLWSELEERGGCTAFQSLAFMRSLEDNVVPERNGQPLYIAIMDKHRDRAAMIVPLTVRKTFGLQRIDFLDHGVADYHFPLIDPAAAANPMIMAGLHKALWQEMAPSQVLIFPKLIKRYLGLPNPLWSTSSLVVNGEGSSRLELSDNTFKAATKGRSIYRDLRRKRAKIQKLEGYRLIEARSSEDVAALLKVMLRQRRERFQAKGILDSFQDPDLFAHYRRLAIEGCPSGKVLLLGIEVERRIIATSYAFCHNHVLTSVLSSMEDGPLARYSPGLVTMLHEIEWARERGLRCYDFGAGSSHYKERFGGSLRPTMALAHACGLRGRIYLAAWKARLFLRLWLMAKPALHAWLRLRKRSLLGLLRRFRRPKASTSRTLPVIGRYWSLLSVPWI